MSRAIYFNNKKITLPGVYYKMGFNKFVEQNNVSMYPEKVTISNTEGFVSIVSISRGIEVGTLSKDFLASDISDRNAVPYFLIIPLSEGTIKVHFAGEPSKAKYYIISEAEVKAYIGTALPYLIDAVLQESTTATFNIGY